MLAAFGCFSREAHAAAEACVWQLDAPQRWFSEAVCCLRELGLRQRSLDPCVFLAYETDFPQLAPSEPLDGLLGEDRLYGCFCSHG